MGKVSTLRRWPDRDKFGGRIRALMAERRMTDAFLCGLLLGQHYEITQPYLNQIKNGRIPVMPDVVDHFCKALQLDATARLDMHRAAAHDYGYDMGVI